MASIPIEILVTAKDMASATMAKVGAGVQQAGSNIKQFSQDNREGLIALSALGVAAVAAGKSFVDAAGFVQQQRAAFRTLIGDVSLAEKTYSDLVNFAAKTPFQIPDILEQSKRLLAMGTSAKDLTKTFGMLGDVASGVGMEKLPQLVLAFGQIQAKGRLMGTELRQLTEAGFNLADAMGISNAKLDELVSNGEVKFEDVRKAFEKVTAEGGRFHGLMEQLNKTTPGQLSNLSDNFFKLKAALGDALLPAVNALVQALLPLLAQFAAFAQQHPQLVAGIMAIALGIGAIGAVLLILGPIIAGATALFSVFSAVATAVGAVLGAISLPVLLIIAAIAALIAIGYLLITNWQTISTTAQMVWNQIITGIMTFVQGAIAWFQQLPTVIGQFFYNLFVEQIPFAVGYAIGWLSVAIPQLVNNIIAWLQQLPGRVLAIFQQVVAFIVQKITEAANFLKGEISSWPGKIQGFIQSIPDIVRNVFHALYEAVLDRLNAAWGVITGFKDRVVGAFNAIVDAVNRAIDAIRRGIEAGKQGVPHFQTGGIVPGPIGKPVLATVHGGEEVVPVGRKGGDGGGGGGVSLTVNIGLYAGTETEKRNIASELYDSLVRIARAQNMSVADLMGA